MNREEILAEAQRDSGRGNEYEKSVAVKSGLVDVLAAIAIVLILVISEYCIKGTFNWGVMSVASTLVCADCLYMGIKNKKAWRIICGILSGLFALSMIIMFFNQLVAL